MAAQEYILKCLTDKDKKVTWAQRVAISQYMALCKESSRGERCQRVRRAVSG